MADPEGKPLHCPTCAVDLLKIERQGIEFNHCPDCKGVWLEAVELQKIYDRSLGDE